MNFERIGKLIPRLATDHEGEIVATVHAIRRTLDADGATLHDLADAIIAPVPVDQNRHDDYRHRGDTNYTANWRVSSCLPPKKQRVRR